VKQKSFIILFFVILVSFVSAISIQADQGTYIVKPGDTISSIALEYGVKVSAIVAANNLPNPNFIVSGMELVIPDVTFNPTATPIPDDLNFITHVVQPGETTWSISMLYGVTVDSIVEANDLPNFRLISNGQELIIPGISPTPTPKPATVGATTTGSTPPSAPTSPAIPAIPAGSTNLFTNPSFESGWYNHNNVQELQVPQGWFMYVDEGANSLVPGAGGVFYRPESRVFADANLPANEQVLFLWNGTHGIKVFKGGAPTHFGLFTDVYLQPGTYRATFNFFADAVMAYEGGTKIYATDPLSAEYRIIHGTGGTGWTSATMGSKNTVVYTFTVSSTGAVRLGVGFRNRYVLANNGWMIDDWSLVKVN